MRKKEKKTYILTLLFTLLALIAMVVYSFVSFYSNAVSNMDHIGESSLAEECKYLEGYLAQRKDVLQVAAVATEYMMQHNATPEEIKNFLTEESKRYTEDIDANFTGLYGLFNGVYIDGTDWVPEEDYVPQERVWYKVAQQAQGKPTIVAPYLDAKTNQVMFSVSQMLYDNESVISLDIVLNQIQDTTEDINMDGKGYGFVIDKTGLVVAHSDKSEKGKHYESDPETKRLINQIFQANGTTFHTQLNGENCTVFSDKVMNDWYVTMIISNTRLYQDIRDILIHNIILSIIVFALIAYFYTIAFRKINLHMKTAEESQLKLKTMNRKIMRTLARTIDAKDQYTNGHSLRVAEYARKLAKRMGKTKSQQDAIYYAALLHDVGKIHTPDAIINKPTRLTRDEFDYIKLHPISGYYILRDIDEIAQIAQGAKWHHERYDGNGYPNGLKGENIPEVARIIGVADAYDAMTSNRSYRTIMPQEKVRSEIENGKGTQFDPAIADIMLHMIDEDSKYEMRQKTEQAKNILAVDDDTVHLVLIKSILEDLPEYNIYTETSGKDALETLQKTDIDLVLLDIQMPGMNGFEVYEEIRKTSNIPIVFLTAENSLETLQKTSKIKIDDCLFKPIMPLALLEILRSILQEEVDV